MYAWISYFAVAIVETLGYMIFADAFMESKWKGGKQIIIFLSEYVTFSLLGLAISYFIRVESLPMIRVSVLTVILIIFFKVFYIASWGKCIFIGSMCMVLNMTIDLSFMWITMGFYPEWNILQTYLSKSTYLVLFIWIRKYFYPMKRTFQRTNIHWMHYGWFPVLSTIAAWYFTFRYAVRDDHYLFFSFISVVLTVLNIFAMSVLKRSLESEEKLEDMELRVMQKQNQLQLFNGMQSMYERQGRKIHDYKKQLSSIQELLEAGDTQAAIGLVGSLTNSLSVELSEVNVGHSIVNAVLNQHHRIAKEQGIGMIFAVEEVRDLRIDDEDIVILFGNLLENAVHECARLRNRGVKDVAVKVKITNRNGKVLFSVSNPVYGKVEIKENRVVRESEPGHGIGLGNVREVVEKYGGELEISCDEKDFLAVVMI
ncbi:MAG: GHKL domain-containing protein [Lachnospiraceae bacterium]|nr:GHKL domain-containing protein [Lachnospiraceae bacterium]